MLQGVFVISSLLAGAATTPLAPNAEIRRLLAERVDALGGGEAGIGIVVALVGPQGRRVFWYGSAGHDRRALDGDTGFEIGSVTKVFTALLLADMVESGEVALTDPVSKHLPPGSVVPARNGRSISLVDLATHTSGLPFMPSDLPAFDDAAGAKYSAAQLYRFLATWALPDDVGSRWEYSNVGYWLLGQALAARASTDFETLLRTRVLDPLELKRTVIAVPASLNASLADGHNAVLLPAPRIAAVPVFAVMPAAGGLVSTANDLAALLAKAMGRESSRLTRAMSSMLATRRPHSQPRVEQALGWIVMGEGEDQLIVHDGGTLGFASSVAWDPKQRIGVVVLSNQVADVGDLARHLLRPSSPLARPTATKRTAIALDTASLDACVGRYEAKGEGAFIVGREGNLLTLQLPPDWGLPTLRLHPESAHDFFVTELPLRITCRADGQGRVIGLLVHPPRGQKPVSADRIDASLPR